MFSEEGAPPTLYRLNALMGAGYRIDTGTSQKVENAIWLEHPATARTAEPVLILYNDGLVVAESAAKPERPQLRIGHSEHEVFRRFVFAVPKATLWERSRSLRTNLLAWAVLFGVWAAAYLLTAFIVRVLSNQ